MAQIEASKRSDGRARQIARDAVKREAAQRELAAKQRQIEILKTFADRQFGKLNRSLVWAIIWILLLGGLFFVAAWFAEDLFSMLLAALESPKTK